MTGTKAVNNATNETTSFTTREVWYGALDQATRKATERATWDAVIEGTYAVTQEVSWGAACVTIWHALSDTLRKLSERH